MTASVLPTNPASDRITRWILIAVAIYSSIPVSFLNLVILNSDKVKDRAVFLMADGMILLWIIVGGSLTPILRKRLVPRVAAIPIDWRLRFVLFCTAMALIEEAITTTMTNLAPVFGSTPEENHITASTNYFHVVLCHSVVQPSHDRWGQQGVAVSDNPNRQRFQAAYEGTPPWDLGRPQQAFIQIGDQIVGSVLDVGCGTGDNALFFAQRGHPVFGIDFVEFPIKEAKRRAAELGVEAEFLQMDALKLTSLDRKFDSVIDCGLFHVLTDADRFHFVAGLAHVTKQDGKLFLMCFSDEEPSDRGPRRITQAEIRKAFADGWTIESITPSQFEPNPKSPEVFKHGGPKAWFVILRRGS